MLGDIHMLIYVNNAMCLSSHDYMICMLNMLMMYMLNYANDVMWLLSHDDMMYMPINVNDVK